MLAAAPIRVMLVDDHAVTRAGYRFLVDNLPDISVVAEAANGEDALTFYNEFRPDIVILDLSMPGLGGRQVLDSLRKQWPDCRVLVCTMHETRPLIEQVMQSGAAGYISKNSSPEYLVRAVRRIAQGQKYIDADLVQTLLVADPATDSIGLAALTPREFQILGLFAEAHSVEAIGRQLSLSNKTVANNLTAIREKLHVSSTAELVRLAISQGLAPL